MVSDGEMLVAGRNGSRAPGYSSTAEKPTIDFRDIPHHLPDITP
jgi:hypothetical protein